MYWSGEVWSVEMTAMNFDQAGLFYDKKKQKKKKNYYNKIDSLTVFKVIKNVIEKCPQLFPR